MALICTALLANLSLLAGSAKAAPLPTGATLIGYQASWQYWRQAAPPTYSWIYVDTIPGWNNDSSAPFGNGTDADIKTKLSAPSASIMSTYYRKSFTLDTSTLTDGATLTIQVDDGVIAYFNGYEVGRHRMANTGYINFADAKAISGITRADAVKSPVSFKVPQSYIRNGKNIISVMSAAYGGTSLTSFDATLTAGGGGLTPNVERPTAGMPRFFYDDFNDPTAYSKNWTEENNSTLGASNNQEECNQEANVNLRGSGTGSSSYLEITAVRQHTDMCGWPNNPGSGPREYASGVTSTKGKVERMYGLIEMRAMVPLNQGSSQGLWPAFWMRPGDGSDGEIDILEGLGSTSTGDQSQSVVHQTLHRTYEAGAPNKHVSYNYLMPNDAAMVNGEWHTYAVEWSPTQIRFFVDNVMTFKVTSSDPVWGQYYQVFVNKGYFIRLNMAVGGNWPGSPDANTAFPASYKIDYVAWYGGQAPPA